MGRRRSIGKTANRTKITRLAILALASAACVAPLCAAAERTLVVYSPHGREICERFEKRFEASRPDVDVQWFPLGANEALNRIRAEARNPQCDVFWGGPSDLFEQAAEAGLLAPYRPTWSDLVGADEKSAADLWHGQFVLPIVIGFNDRLLDAKDAPRTFRELLDPRWEGKILLRFPIGSGTMTTFIGTLFIEERARAGEAQAIETLRALDRNVKEYPASPTLLFQKLGRGEGIVTVWGLTDMIFQKRTYGYDFGYLFPEDGAPEIVDCVAIVRSDRDPEPARAFYEMVSSREASIEIAADFYRIPARRDIAEEQLPDWLRGLHRKAAPVPREALAREGREIMETWASRAKRRSFERPGGVALALALLLIGGAGGGALARSRRRRAHAAAAA
jgi:iron(III) transport system substrate-binding protein